MDFSVDPALIAACVDELGTPGRLPSGGLFRGVYTPEWLAAQAIVTDWFERAGLDVRRDAAGNLFGRLAGTAGGPAYLTGSHIDTVREGGRFDGGLGIIAAYLAARTLKERYGQPRRPVEAIVTCEEEGSRYQANYWGTRAITGQIEPAEVEELRDEAGLPIGEAMRAVGLDPNDVSSSRREDIAGFIELHIEQGPVLEREGVDVAVVDTITGIRRSEAWVEGQADHAGTTPMNLRRDALQASAEMVLAIARIAEELGHPAVATVGRLAVQPDAFNIVPGQVHFGIDTRHPSTEAKQALLDEIAAHCHEIAQRRGVTVRIDHLRESPPADLDKSLRQTITEAAETAGASHRILTSGAGHDASIMASRYPAAMIFVPSHNGRSHTPAEYTSAEQAAKGVAVLAATLYRLAYE